MELLKRRGLECFTLVLTKNDSNLVAALSYCSDEGNQKGGLDHYTSDVSAILGAMTPGSYRSALGKCSPSIYRQTHTEERVSRPSDFGFTSCWLLDLHRGVGPRGVWGGRTPPRIRGLCSKNFENSQIQLFF